MNEKNSMLKFCPAVIIEKFFDRLSHTIAHLVKPGRFNTIFDWMESIGHLALYPTLLIGLIFAITASIQLKDGEFMFRAVIFVLLIPILHYATVKMLKLNERLISATAERLNAPAIIHALAIICAVGGVMLLISDVYFTFKFGAAKIVDSLVRFVFLESLALCAFSYRSLNISDDEKAGIGESALTLLAFAGKAILKQSSAFFCLFSLLGLFGMSRAMYLLMGKATMWDGVNTGMGYARIILITVLLPIAVTVLYLALSLLLDLAKAIISREKK